MKKKLIAVAVAGALGAPAVALAQASTVQIYGTLLVNYNYFDGGDRNVGTATAPVRAGRDKFDMFNAHDANIGFKGEEALGGGLSAWFQCESTADLTGEGSGASDTHWCGRNSGVGFKGGFGNVWYGIWDTPLKISAGPLRPFSTSGAFGMGSLMWNESGSNVGNGFLGVDGGATERASFTRRQNNTVNYWTPNFGGFQAGVSWSGQDERTALFNTAGFNAEPRLWSIGASYTNGPLYIGGGYENHKDYNPANVAAYGGGDDNGWNVGVAYTIAGNIKLSLIYASQEYETQAGQTLEHDAWGFFLDWRIAGPHRIRAEYVWTDDIGGNSTVGVNQFVAPVTTVGGVLVGRGDTGGQLFGIQYAYGFSKRTEVNVGFAKVKNDGNAIYRLQTLGGAPFPGDDQSAWVLGVKHTF
jgi:predicted porin